MLLDVGSTRPVHVDDFGGGLCPAAVYVTVTKPDGKHE